MIVKSQAIRLAVSMFLCDDRISLDYSFSNIHGNEHKIQQRLWHHFQKSMGIFDEFSVIIKSISTRCCVASLHFVMTHIYPVPQCALVFCIVWLKVIMLLLTLSWNLISNAYCLTKKANNLLNNDGEKENKEKKKLLKMHVEHTHTHSVACNFDEFANSKIASEASTHNLYSNELF